MDQKTGQYDKLSLKSLHGFVEEHVYMSDVDKYNNNMMCVYLKTRYFLGQ